MMHYYFDPDIQPETLSEEEELELSDREQLEAENEFDRRKSEIN
jgi:hypothetical protein